MDPSTGTLVAFTVAAAILTVTPGLDTALVLRTAAVDGTRAAFAAGVGIVVGCLAWAGIVAAGLGAILAASETVYAIVRWIGAGYLVWLGVGLIWRPRRSFETASAFADQVGGRVRLRQGFLTNILNPKIGIFYVSFLPQFIPVGASVPIWSMLLASIHALLALLWLALLIACTQPAVGLLRQSSVISWLDRITGGLFIAFGLKLALDVRR